MAGKVGVAEGEYNSLYTSLENAQEEFMSAIDNIKGKISELNCEGGGFYTDNVTPNIESLLCTLGKIQSSIREVYSAEKEIIDNFQKSIDNIDTCC